jgi:predicted anti-sigma-YlaC factor YlaD
MKHDSIHKNLIFYLGNELSDELRISVEEHLKECAECQRMLEFLKEEMQVIEKEKNPEASPFFFTRLSTRLDDRPQYRQQGLWLRIAQPAFFSVMLILGIYGGLQIGSSTSSGRLIQESTSTIQIMNDFEAEPIESFLLYEL